MRASQRYSLIVLVLLLIHIFASCARDEDLKRRHEPKPECNCNETWCPYPSERYEYDGYREEEYAPYYDSDTTEEDVDGGEGRPSETY